MFFIRDIVEEINELVFLDFTVHLLIGVYILGKRMF